MIRSTAFVDDVDAPERDVTPWVDANDSTPSPSMWRPNGVVRSDGGCAVDDARH